jgi:hypothetical protein
MATTYEVTGIKRSQKTGRIVALCGTGFDCWPRKEVLRRIDAGERFVVESGGKHVEVHAVPKGGGADRYLRTVADDVEEDNLEVPRHDTCNCQPGVADD